MRTSDDRFFSMKYILKFSFITGVLVFASVVGAQITRGTPGVDYPNYDSIPETSFKCSEQKYIPGFYADPETDCQVFYFCFEGRHESFLCPTGTIFNQKLLSCDSWYTFNCSLAPIFYNVNAGPTMERAGRNLLLLQMGKFAQRTSTSKPILDTILHSTTDSQSERVETSSTAGDMNEVAISNVSRDKTTESLEDDEATENQKLSENALSESEDSRGDEMYRDSSANELDEVENKLDDQVEGGYYLDYDPYETEWQDSDPVSDEFKRFYDYENLQDEYRIQLQGYDEDEESEIVAEPSGLDSNDADSDETGEREFFRRQLVGKMPNRYRKRPMYVVVEDEEGLGEEYLGDEPGIQMSEDSTEIPVGTTTEGGQDSDYPFEDLSEADRQRVLFANQGPSLPFVTRRPLTSDEFGRLLQAEFGDEAQSDMDDSLSQHETYSKESSEDVSESQDQYVEARALDGYISDSSEFDVTRENAYDENSEDTDDNETEEAEPQESTDDDTLIVIPDEYDSPSDANSAAKIARFQLEDGSIVSGYTYEVDPNEQSDDGLRDPGYDSYEDAYEYYQSHRQFPEGYETVESASVQGPGFDYYGQYGGQFVQPAYGDYEEARLAYLASLRNSGSYYVQRPDYRPDFTDSVYDAESGYYRDDFSYNPYVDETADFYSRPGSWAQQESLEDIEIENRLGTTESPLPLDVTEAVFNQDDLNNIAESEDIALNDFTVGDGSDKQSEEMFYVFDFDEDKESTLNNADEDFEPDAKSINVEDTLPSGESSQRGNYSLYKKAEAPLEFRNADGEMQSVDAFLTSQNAKSKPADSFSTGAAAFKNPMANTWSSLDKGITDKPVTLSAMEQLAGLNTPKVSGFNRDFVSDSQFLNNMALPESMDFGPYGYGAQMRQQYGMMDSMQPSKTIDGLSHRSGEQQNVPKLSTLQERLRSMKQGKFGAFKKYMSSVKNI